jgi:hypothetical protein
MAAALALTGCLEEQRYAIERESVRLRANAEPAFVDDDDNAIFVAQRRFELQIRPPMDAILQQLGQAAQGMNLPFPRLPWVEYEDVEIRVDYVLENRSDEEVSAMVFLDGINEFNVYTPGPEDFHQYERRLAVPAQGRVEGTITELEMDEVAVDLATVVNEVMIKGDDEDDPPNSALIVQFQSQSTRDPRVKPYIPSTIPGLVAFNMGVQTGGLGGGEMAPELFLRLSARVQDHGDRVAERGESRWTLPTPVEFVPVVPEED